MVKKKKKKIKLVRKMIKCLFFFVNHTILQQQYQKSEKVMDILTTFDKFKGNSFFNVDLVLGQIWMRTAPTAG